MCDLGAHDFAELGVDRLLGIAMTDSAEVKIGAVADISVVFF
jgi:hypothetical protein